MLDDYLFSELFRKLCETAGEDSTALIDADGKMTCGEIRDAVDSLAVCLIEGHGLREGDCVGLAGQNSISWMLHFWAIIRAGGIAVVENDLLKGSEIMKHYEYQELRFMLAGDVSDQLLADLKALLGDKLKRFVEMPLQPPSSEQRAMLDDREDSLPVRHDAIGMFSSGTMSRPKMIRLSQEALLYDAEKAGMRMLLPFEYHAIFVPFSHILGLVRLASYMRLCDPVIIASKNSPQSIADICRRYHINEITNVPTVVKMLAEHPDFETIIKPQIDYLCIGGTRISAEEAGELEDLYDAKLNIGYGMTEASGVVSLADYSKPQSKRYSTVGNPLDDIEVRIAMPDPDGKGNMFCPAGKSGEVIVRGNNIMNGFFEDGQYRQAADGEGYFHTGDLGYLDEEGFLHINGRIKNIIIKGGENIMPGEIEECIRTLPDIEEVIVIGVPDKKYGEEIAALVIPKAGCTVTIDEVREAVAKNYTRFKQPGYLLLYDEFPMTRLGKPDIISLKDDALSRISNT
ncbi:MAG: acyl--CoA ligase [Mogibacterium sp.]|nr:acyl--CoA ligase [Mogibacterium sp.]